MRRFMGTLGALLLFFTHMPVASAQQESGASTPSAQQIASELHCRRVHCECATAPFASDDGLVFQPQTSDGCRQVICRCLPGEDVPEEVGETLPTPETPSELFTERPAPVYGFPMARRDVGVRLELGYPYLDIGLMYGVHDVVEIGAGYRGMYTMSFGGYGSLKFRLYRSTQRNAALSLNILGGYHHVPQGEGHDKITGLAGGDGAYLELSLAMSVGRRGHYFTAASGVRLAWVREQPSCATDEYGYAWDCYETVFNDGHGGFMPVAFLDLGYAARVWRHLSLFILTGFDAFTNSDSFLASVRFRLGFMFDF